MVLTIICVLLSATWFIMSYGMRPTAPFQEEEYHLEQQVMQQSKQPAPPAISEAILAPMRTELEAQRREGLWDGSMEHLIAVIPIDLNRDGIADYLAIPDHLIPDFHGAHAIRFWVFAGQAEGGFRLMLSGQEDSVRLSRTMSHGYRDVVGIYNQEIGNLWRYDGQSYQRQER